MTEQAIVALAEGKELVTLMICSTLIILSGLKTWRTRMVTKSQAGDPEV